MVRTPEALHFCLGTFSSAADITSSAKQGPWTSHSLQEKPFWKEPGEFSLWVERPIPSGFSEETAFLTHSPFGTQAFSRSFPTRPDAEAGRSIPLSLDSLIRPVRLAPLLLLHFYFGKYGHFS